MIISMTGYGKATKMLPNKKITVEIKSLNSKTLDLNVRLPQFIREHEMTIRTLLSDSLMRGKIDLSIYVENESEVTNHQINVPVVKNYMQQINQLDEAIPSLELIKLALKFPETLKTERETLEEEDWGIVKEVLEEALQQIETFRVNEGDVLAKDFTLRINNIQQLLQSVEVFESERKTTLQNRLKTALEQLAVEVDLNRFEQELIYYLEKLDITEEKVRLSNHLDYFLETMKDNNGNGRKLGFILQEIGREINTLGSKANHAGIQKSVVLMKDELEKIKEQCLNVL